MGKDRDFALSICKVFSIQRVKELYLTTPAAVFSFQVSYIVCGSFLLSEAKSEEKKKILAKSVELQQCGWKKNSPPQASTKTVFSPTLMQTGDKWERKVLRRWRKSRICWIPPVRSSWEWDVRGGKKKKTHSWSESLCRTMFRIGWIASQATREPDLINETSVTARSRCRGGCQGVMESACK